MVCVKNPFTKKPLESKLHRKYELNLLNEPQHLAEIKTLKPLKIPNKGVTNLRERKLKHHQLKLCKKYTKNVHISFLMSRLEFFDMTD